MSLTWSLQALLVRHEAYMADAQQERTRMTASIEKLELEKRNLETKNAQIVEENRCLLEQLEGLNNAVTESDSQVKSLTATLHATQLELQRLAVLASRTEQLERQLSELERDQAELHATLESTEEDEKTAVQRWRQAERTIADLQDQVDRIEQEAREERERHVEVVGRMERRLVVEKELKTAGGRLSGAAAGKGNDAERNGTNVISHFVKDILQDNANLQMGIVELKEMLQSSNDEVEKLRDQLQLHQPLQRGSSEQGQGTTLQTELSPPETVRKLSQELHVHHHYHPAVKTPVAGSRIGTPGHRRAKKKRTVVSPGHFTPPSGSSTPRIRASSATPTAPSSATAILAQTSVTIPRSTPNRWSTQSNTTTPSIMGSSAPSSPYSPSNRTSSIFSRVFSDSATDSERPTSPDTTEPGSPLLLPARAKQQFKLAPRSFTCPTAFRLKSEPSAAISCELNTTIPEHTSDTDASITDLELNGLPTPTKTINEANDFPSLPPITETPFPPPQHSFLRRAASHESLLSVSGMDIHTLRHRPSQLLTLSSSISTNPVLSQATAIASRPTLLAAESPSVSRSLLSGIAAEQRAAASTSTASAGSNFGRRVGGWVLGKWGVAPVSSAAPVYPQSYVAKRANSEMARPAGGVAKSKVVPTVKLRPPGVNQDGPLLWSLQAEREKRAEAAKKASVVAGAVDEEALRESLREG